MNKEETTALDALEIEATAIDSSVADIEITACTDAVVTEDPTANGEAANGEAPLTAAKEGKHTLRWDSIFKGPKNRDDQEEDTYYIPTGNNVGAIFYETSKNSEEYDRLKLLKEAVFEILKEQTDVCLDNTRPLPSRRKPSKANFNAYFELLCSQLPLKTLSRGEIFVELAFYFSDNLYNMFKLLNKEHSKAILAELRKKYHMRRLDDIVI